MFVDPESFNGGEPRECDACHKPIIHVVEITDDLCPDIAGTYCGHCAKPLLEGLRVMRVLRRGWSG